MNKAKRRFFISCAMLTALATASSCSLQGPTGPQGEQGIQGEQGPKGDQGNPGADGKDGSRIRTGEGAPSNGVGSDGDLYVDTSTGDLYEMKESVWVKTGNIRGSDGKDGKDGVSVVSIAKTATEGKTDTYTITYSDGSTSQFVVTNGEDGSQGVQGVPGKDGHAPNITIGDNGHWYVDGADTGIPARGEKGEKGDKGQDAVTYVPCIFNNYDGTKLWEFYFEKGTDAVYSGPTPTKPDGKDGEDVVKWTFTGWDKPLTNIQKPMIFTAKYEWLCYDCTFINYDGTVLQASKVNRGEDAIYIGKTPWKDPELNGDRTIEWRFSGWDKPLTNITKDTVFTATFDAPNAIKCTFINYDGSLLGYGYCGVGGNVAYSGTTPSKPDNDDGNGTVVRSKFIGWDKSLEDVKTTTTFTAQFAETDYYRCDFMDYDGTLLESNFVCDGQDAKYKGPKPTRNKTVVGTAVTEYSFGGWDKSLFAITAPTIFTAKYYATTYTGYCVNFLNTDGSPLYTDYFKKGTTAYCPSNFQPWSFDDENVTMLVGWDTSVSNLSSDVKTKAKTRTLTRSQNGEWPQTKETDAAVVDALNGLKPGLDGYYHLGKNRYALGDNHTWRRVEPIRWRFLSSTDHDVFVLSERSLTYRRYNEYYKGKRDGVYANNYKNSEIRSWLNGEFIRQAFLDDSLIVSTLIDNSLASADLGAGVFLGENPFVCENTCDRAFLLSVQDAKNPEYGFEEYSKNRVCKDADGEFCSWWLRSPYPYESYSVSVVSTGVNFSASYVNQYDDYGVRPALHLRID